MSDRSVNSDHLTMRLWRSSRVLFGKHPMVFGMTCWAKNLEIAWDIRGLLAIQMMYYQKFWHGRVSTGLTLGSTSLFKPTSDPYNTSLTFCVSSFKKCSTAIPATIAQFALTIRRKRTMELGLAPSTFVPSSQILYSISVRALSGAKRLFAPTMLGISFTEFLFAVFAYLHNGYQLTIRNTPLMSSGEVSGNTSPAPAETKIRLGF